MEVTLNRFEEWPAWDDLRAVAETAARAAVAAAGSERSGELSITLLSDTEMRELNQRFLGRDRSTDVLAFSLNADGDDLVGDVYLCPEQVLRNADEFAVAPGEEALRVVIHGVLHALGMDHPDVGREASEMFRLQERLLRSLSPS